MSKRRPRPRGTTVLPSFNPEAFGELERWLEREQEGFAAQRQADREALSVMEVPQIREHLRYTENGISVIDYLLSQLRHEERRWRRANGATLDHA